MARKLTPMLQWMSGEVSRRSSGRKLTSSQRARLFRQVGREARRKFKKR